MEHEEQLLKISDLIRYSVSAATIAEITARCSMLVVKDPTDKAGRDRCYEARQEVKKLRVEVERRRKELKQESLDFGRIVDQKARELREPLEEIEAKLKEQQDIVDLEEQRQKEAARKLLSDRADARFRELSELGAELPPYDVIFNMEDGLFGELIANAETAKKEKELEEKLAKQSFEAERERQRLENEKLELERKEAQEKAARQEEENRKLREQILEKEQEENRRLKEEAKEREVREAKLEAEQSVARALKEREETERQLREEAAARKVRNEKLLDDIKKEFPTIEAAWVEIISLREFLSKLERKLNVR